VTWPLGDSTATSFDVNIDYTCRSRSWHQNIPQEPCSLEFQLTNQRQAGMTSFKTKHCRHQSVKASQPDNIERSRASHPTDIWKSYSDPKSPSASFFACDSLPQKLRRGENFSSQPTPLINDMIAQLRPPRLDSQAPVLSRGRARQVISLSLLGGIEWKRRRSTSDSSHWARQNLNAEVVDAYATTSVGQIPSPRVEGTKILTLRFFSSRCAGEFSALSGAEWRQFNYL
jgi:hypothetical protein